MADFEWNFGWNYFCATKFICRQMENANVREEKRRERKETEEEREEKRDEKRGNQLKIGREKEREAITT